MARPRLSRASRASATALTGALLVTLVFGNAPNGAAADETPRDPGVARLSVLNGSVDVKRADSGDTVSAAINAPVSAGDYLSTQDDSRAEVQFDYGTNLRVASDTQVRFTRLDPQNHEIQLALGTVDLRVFRGLEAHAQVETPQATIRPDESGSYVVSVDQDGNSQVSARSGRVDVITQTSTQTLSPGSTLAISGDANAPQFASIASVAYGAFDGWIAGRDRYFERVADYRYVDAGMVGADDLYGNGRWVDYPRYGQVWVPTVAAGWAPYHNGRWVWEPYYGWTWVDNEPWGWAPFHYGNWFYGAGTGWAWYPGAYAVARPYVYRPALVAFFSFGGGGLSLGFGNIGWVPLAPFEPFRPWWGGYGPSGYNRTTIINNNTTIVNNYNITNVYHNATAPGGATGTNNRNFANGNFTNIRTLQPVQIAHAEAVRNVVPIVPTAHNLGFLGHDTVRPLAPVPRFAAFHSQPTFVQPTFAQQQATVKSTAIRAYPTHAESIARFPAAPDAQPRTPGDIVPRTPVDVSPRALPAVSRPAYAMPGRALPPEASRTTARPRTDPFARFKTGAGSGVNAAGTPDAASGGAKPGYRAPGGTVPNYRTPVYRTPVYRTPVPLERAPSPATGAAAPAYRPSDAPRPTHRTRVDRPSPHAVEATQKARPVEQNPTRAEHDR